MRPLTSRDAIRAVELTARFPRVHGSPVHIGDPVCIPFYFISLFLYFFIIKKKRKEIIFN